MCEIIDEIASEETAKKLKNVTVESMKVYKDENKITAELLSNDIFSYHPVAKLKEEIQQRFGVKSVELITRYSGTLSNDEEFTDKLFQNIKEEIFCEVPVTHALLTDSSAKMSDVEFVITLKFGGGETLTKNNIDKRIHNILKNTYGADLKVSFINGSDGNSEVETKLEQELSEFKEEAKLVIPKQKKVIKAKKHEKTDETNEDLLIGKEFSGEVTPMCEIAEYTDKVIVEGRIIDKTERDIKDKWTLLELYLTDDTSSMTCKSFVKKEDYAELGEKLKPGNEIAVNGKVEYDQFAKERVIMIKDMVKTKLKKRMDTAEKKRVELHAHTAMSALDAVSKTKALVETAARFGHKAIAITDHGVVQAFPDAMAQSEKNGIKILYGVEAYLMGDEAKICYNETSMPIKGSFVVFDIETTSLSGKFGEIIEIAGVKLEGGAVCETFSKFVKPKREIPYFITELTNITNEMVKNAESIEIILPEFLKFCEGSVLVAHNANFDVGFIKRKAEEQGIYYEPSYIDTLALSRRLLDKLKRHKLDKVAKHLGISFEGHHRAINDAEVTAKIFLRFCVMMEQMDVSNVLQINEKLHDESVSKYTELYHTIILTKNMTGLRNLYKLISDSHLYNFYKKPRMTKKMLTELREGLIIGSACEAGELYRAILSGKTEREIEKIADFYDYLEIQPLGNNDFMLRNHTVSTTEDLKNINREIVSLGERKNKKVVATCDVHFINPEDEVYRRILMSGQDYDDADNQPPLFLRTTDEMLSEFMYLGAEKAREVVIDNTNYIADLCEEIRPIPKETFAPEMPGSREEIQELCNKSIERIYGDNPQQIVIDRMNKELRPIMKYGFDVMYMIAQKLVAKSNSDGYLVGSRGSVGSSFVAFLSGITEINSLPAHYICPNCKNCEFPPKGTYAMGADMPDEICPKCGAKYKKDGYDIPFETFLGFDGDKEPDIDLNFSGDYQPVAHKYTEVLFGEGNVFRAGTIGTFAEKNARGFVIKYAEKKGITFNKAEMVRLSKGIEGIKRTTGQHPGGVMILPRKNEIYQVTPIQHPADKDDVGIITTHFDYHSISGKLLKLDILGHDDPTMIRKLENLTGLDAKTIPIDDKPTMSLFTSTEALGIKPEDICGTTVGTYAVPEFGTKFVRQMLLDTKPTTFAELIRISGLSHGTNVWVGNAQELVRQGIASLPEAICTRDDIMLYLLQKGLPDLTSFKIMEAVRKGKGLTEENEALMREHGVPDWYIDSCKKIQYMFPKAHAAAYVTMGFRVAYFKVHYPLEFYLAYFSIRAQGAFDAKLMIYGKERVVSAIKEIEGKPDTSQKEKDVLTVLEVVNEMYARGIKFLPIDVYKSHHSEFVAENGNIRPPLNSIDGLGSSAAESIIKARQQGEFISVEDLMKRAKVGRSVTEKLAEYDALGSIPETSQVGLFDFM